ncbi:hypothetical protein K3G39_16840 [Pontibacter sp. HSC-14F20]|uniref:hypothetical protein n=1 Tax=Pontibacter sp. HSC-14F20 TaxID=2864136 RepID=UPI001C732429|nr:hypothetical protein [Pontibacter sp. HSC-14F20]MBX0334906.1 hypothetical protein [Pontibacter sp. HSC-14F20]
MKTAVIRFGLSMLAICLFSANAEAQFTHTNNMEARPVHEYNTITMIGSPYLYKDWAKGSLTLKNGTVYQGIDLMYDQVKDAIIFKGKNGELRELLEPVQEFKIGYIENSQQVERTFRSGYSGDGVTANVFMEVLADGQVALLKRTSKKIFDRKQYSSATIEREVQENEDYYIAKGDKAVKVKKSKSSLLAAIPDKKDYLETYIKSNALNLRDDSDMAKLVAYYNSL